MATFWVTTLTDEHLGANDRNGKDGSGVSLREAIDLANARDGKDTIKFASELRGKTLALTSGAIKIKDSLDIIGRSGITVDAQNKGRIFVINDGKSQTKSRVKIQTLSLKRGNSSGNGGSIFNRESLTLTGSKVLQSRSDKNGGAIANVKSATLNLVNSTILQNTSKEGGGGVFNAGVLKLNNTTISQNKSDGETSRAFGGGIASEGSQASAIITNSRIIKNRAKYSGGGISNTRGSTLKVQRSEISNNTSTTFGGGGVVNGLDGVATIQDSTISGNSSGSFGGGLYNIRATLEVSQSQVEENVAAQNGGGIFNAGIANVINTGIIGNQAEIGGGIANGDNSDSGDLTLTNNAIAQNTASLDGGGLFNLNGNVNIGSNVIASNTANRNGNSADIGGLFTSQNDNVIGVNPDGSGGRDIEKLIMGEAVGLTGTFQGLFLGDKTNNQILGSVQNDIIVSFSGSDNNNGRGGNDLLAGGFNSDTLFGGPQNDVLLGNQGNDRLNGGTGADDLFGGIGNDQLIGQDDGDVLVGGPGKDTLSGGNGSDGLIGGLGNDLLVSGSGNRDLMIGVNSERRFGVGELDTLRGGAGEDLFAIGDKFNVYYDDGKANSSGRRDFALIQNFSVSEDTILVNGARENYTFKKVNSDTEILLGNELIAIVQGVNNLSVSNLGN